MLRGAKQIFDAPLSTKLMVLTIEFTPRDTTVTLFVEGRGTDSVIVPISTTMITTSFSYSGFFPLPPVEAMDKSRMTDVPT